MRNVANIVAGAAILLIAGCATPIYKSPSPTSHAVKAVKQEIATFNPSRTQLSLSDAKELALPIFEAMRYDATQVCMVMGEADTCARSEFVVLNEAHINAYAGPNDEGQPTVTLTRGLIEQFANEPDELGLIVGHEFGHLLAAHPEEGRKNAERSGAVLGAALAILSAAAMASSNADHQAVYGPSVRPLFSQEYMSYVIQGTLASGNKLGKAMAYKVFSKGQENEADYLGTYLAWRNGYRPEGQAFVELGALADKDMFSESQKRRDQKPYAFWNSHPTDANRAARVNATLSEIEALHAGGQERPLPPKFVTRYAKQLKTTQAQVLKMALVQDPVARRTSTSEPEKQARTSPAIEYNDSTPVACRGLTTDQVRVSKECRRQLLNRYRHPPK